MPQVGPGPAAIFRDASTIGFPLVLVLLLSCSPRVYQAKYTQINPPDPPAVRALPRHSAGSSPFRRSIAPPDPKSSSARAAPSPDLGRKGSKLPPQAMSLSDHPPKMHVAFHPDIGVALLRESDIPPPTCRFTEPHSARQISAELKISPNSLDYPPTPRQIPPG